MKALINKNHLCKSGKIDQNNNYHCSAGWKSSNPNVVLLGDAPERHVTDERN